ncbi:MAG: hypothetical protein MPEBLZ_03038 [Candidatus Methanoperedens nitroreducens]|uniref:Uncharacterized protein n=1 Tax=Candidatus Methanoperedens nitratireducens TaxID=1392998 RepID=A0A0P8A2T4_9EURY|nr:MAG: hypothetical protein MPEBLZ_03038 [Candidatus Methanoperedens sp. BLZ1]MCX9089622.1 DUF6516 family protein [Candidatus Methanoperedens sp.]CAG0999576.1 hypothetical protein METP2_03160 [Methanosarcinales archaeon]
MLENFLADLKASLTASHIVRDIEIDDEFITSVSGFLDCTVVLVNGSTLYVTEYFSISGDTIKREKYSYHLQKDDDFIIRWDNAPHHKELSTFPYHVHDKSGVHKSKEMTMDEVLDELSEKVLAE